VVLCAAGDRCERGAGGHHGASRASSGRSYAIAARSPRPSASSTRSSNRSSTERRWLCVWSFSSRAAGGSARAIATRPRAAQVPRDARRARDLSMGAGTLSATSSALLKRGTPRSAEARRRELPQPRAVPGRASSRRGSLRRILRRPLADERAQVAGPDWRERSC